MGHPYTGVHFIPHVSLHNNNLCVTCFTGTWYQVPYTRYIIFAFLIYLGIINFTECCTQLQTHLELELFYYFYSEKKKLKLGLPKTLQCYVRKHV